MTTYKMWILGLLSDLETFDLSDYTMEFIFQIL